MSNKTHLILPSSAAHFKRVNDIDIAKGLAISLVVYGHIVSRQPPAGNDWYFVSKMAVYSFHMAFFMFLSGIVYFMKLDVVKSWEEYWDVLVKRFMRLMPAYFLFAGIVFLAKWSAQNLMYVDNPVSGLDDLVGIFLFPMRSVSSFLWYVYVLFLFCVVGVSFLFLTRGRLYPLAALGFVLLFIPKIPLLGMDQFCKYFFFFALGGLAIRYWDFYTLLVRWTWILSAAVFLFMLITTRFIGNGWILTALFSLIALHGLCRQKFMDIEMLRYIGRMSFPIYLMNTLSIGFVKAVMIKFIPWHGNNFFYYAPILFFSGLIIPILIKQYIFRHIAWLDKITS